MVAENNGESVMESTATPQDEQMPQEAEQEETKEQKMERAQTLFTEGKRALAAGTLAVASEKLSEACTLFTQVHDPFAAEVFEPHMLYGKTLLELSRLEPGVFTNAMEGAPADDESMDSGDEADVDEKAVAEDDKTEADQNDQRIGNADELTEEQREEIQEQVEEAMAENAEALDKGELPPEDPAQGAEETKEADGAEVEEPTESGKVEEVKDDSVPEEDDAAEESATADEDTAAPEMDAAEDTATNVHNLQLAWEVLDVARAVCDKQEKTDEWQMKKADVLLLLGDVSIEDENYKQAIDDLAVCLDIQHKIFAADDRRIAETLFQMARAFNLSFEFTKAAEYYKKAFDVIKQRVDAHEAKLAAGVECPEEKASLESEVKDLTTLLPDIQLKIDDSLESAKTAEMVKEQADSAPAAAFEDAETAASKPAAADISSLVRKPVKRNVEPEESDPAIKRCKGDEGDAEVTTTTNGNGHAIEANGDNGHATSEA